MKKILLLAGVASMFAFNASAFEFNPYLSAKMKYAFTNDLVRTTDSEASKITMDKDLLGFNGALGVRFATPFGAIRTEAEYVRTADAKNHFYSAGNREKAELRTQGLLFNAYFDFDTGSKFTPYIGGGMGGARIKYSAYDQSIHQTNFAWQVGAGVAYNFCEHLAADLGYRFVDYGSFTSNIVKEEGLEKTRVKSQAQEILLGVRYTF